MGDAGETAKVWKVGSRPQGSGRPKSRVPRHRSFPTLLLLV